MQYEKIYEKVASVLSSRYKVDKEDIYPEAIFMENIKIDSLQLLFFISDVEDIYNIKLNEEELLRAQTLKDFCYLVEKNQK